MASLLLPSRWLINRLRVIGAGFFGRELRLDADIPCVYKNDGVLALESASLGNNTRKLFDVKGCRRLLPFLVRVPAILDSLALNLNAS